ncbi:insulinase family protein [Helicobacter saguini]|uniref:Insulinase family protein n=1 Tax=Helicobacter saguini TaxID=1548018 RepID=A0A347VTW0_9HELI|nr:pitrilysin family protein [Helicobacter saguini]MWV61455.1 insulinase family protein [Helicobacter saguini]MWV67874.1 insulinase family protein [Helicobacter saguini]MWV70657.1 insulinase family protein [Helicobacter saguini]MWV72562.1 insulinase family protein [Helicobacter saguini]TLD94702.1 insulinase family protein [Helicobacter saguini]
MSSIVNAKSASVLPKYESKILENGLQVVVIPLKNNSKVIETNVFYKVGSRNETMGKSGMAHMLEHLNFKSTKNLKAGEFDEIVKKMGGSDNAATSFDYTRYYIRSSKENLDTSLKLFAELMENLDFKDSEFASERDVVAQERLWRTDNSPSGYLFFRFFNTAYTYHPYHWTPIGFMNDIQSWEVADIRAFHSTYYQPQNAIIVVAGDVDSKDVFSGAQKHFAHIKNRGEIPPVKMQEPKQDGAREGIIKKETGGIEWVMMGFKTSKFNDKDQIALESLAEILAGGKSAILPALLTDKLKLASSVTAYNMDLVDSGIFIIIATGNPGVKADSLKHEIIKELERLKKTPIKQEALDKVKINTRASFIYSLESASSVAGLFGSYLVRGDIKPLLEYEKNLDSLDSTTILETAKKYFNEDNSTTLFMRK